MFHKKDLNQNELALLTEENANLSKQSAFLHGKAITTIFAPEKDKIMAERAELETKIIHNQSRIEELSEHQDRFVKAIKEKGC